VRLVELLRGKDELVAGYPEYRIFGIRPDSVYSLLGLENADVIIAANGYIIDSPGKFPKYVSLLSEEKGGEVIIRRGGELLELRYLLS
jgi:general secretion pathway protein C